MVRSQLCGADRGAGRGVAGDPGRPSYPDRGADRLGQDARRLSRGDRRAGAAGARGRPRRRDADRLRVAIEGAVERYPAQPRSSARRHRRGLAPAGAAGGRHPHLGAHRRHRAGRAGAHAPHPAAYRRHHARIALHPARLRIRPQDAGDDANRDRRRDPRGGAEQARFASGGVARTAGGAVRAALCCASACRRRRSRSRRSPAFWSGPSGGSPSPPFRGEREGPGAQRREGEVGRPSPNHGPPQSDPLPPAGGGRGGEWPASTARMARPVRNARSSIPATAGRAISLSKSLPRRSKR